MSKAFSTKQYFSILNKRASDFVSLDAVRKCRYVTSHRDFARHLILAQQWVLKSDLTQAEDPKNTTKKINLQLLLQILEITGFYSIASEENLKKHIVEKYGENHIKTEKEGPFSLFDLYINIFKHNKDWTEFLHKIQYFNSDKNSWNLFLCLLTFTKGKLKFPVASINDEGNCVYKFVNFKGNQYVKFTIEEHEIKVHTFITNKNSIALYSETQQTQVFSNYHFFWEKGFFSMINNFANVIGGG